MKLKLEKDNKWYPLVKEKDIYVYDSNCPNRKCFYAQDIGGIDKYGRRKYEWVCKNNVTKTEESWCKDKPMFNWSEDNKFKVSTLEE